MLFLLRRLFDLVVVPRDVFVEVVEEGLKQDYLDARETKKALDEGWIKVEAVDEKDVEVVVRAEKNLGLRLGMNERQAVSLARPLGGNTILTDDEDASIVSRALGLEPKGTLYVLLKAARSKVVSKDRVTEALERMLEDGFWLSPLIVQRFHRALEKA